MTTPQVCRIETRPGAGYVLGAYNIFIGVNEFGVVGFEGIGNLSPAADTLTIMANQPVQGAAGPVDSQQWTIQQITGFSYALYGSNGTGPADAADPVRLIAQAIGPDPQVELVDRINAGDQHGITVRVNFSNLTGWAGMYSQVTLYLYYIQANVFVGPLVTVEVCGPSGGGETPAGPVEAVDLANPGWTVDWTQRNVHLPAAGARNTVGALSVLGQKVSLTIPELWGTKALPFLYTGRKIRVTASDAPTRYDEEVTYQFVKFPQTNGVTGAGVWFTLDVSLLDVGLLAPEGVAA